MEKTQEISLNRAVSLLKAAGAEFHIKVGDLELGAPIGRHGKRAIRNRGIVDYIKSHVGAMKPGDVVKIYPNDQYDMHGIRGSTASVMYTLFGSDNYITSSNDDHIEALRVE